MPEFQIGISVFLLLNIAAGLIRILRGPTTADRMLAAQLLGTAGVAVLLLLSRGLANQAIEDVALLFALLSGMSGVAFVRLAWHRGRKGNK